MTKTKKRVIPVQRTHHHVDADGQVLGRLATRVATLLRGKHKVGYQPHRDDGDVVVVAHIEKIKISGAKLDQKIYYSYSGYPGGLKKRGMGLLFKKDPADVFRRTVCQMLPPTKHRRAMMKRLVVVR